MEEEDPNTMHVGEPMVRIDALDMFVELLSQVEDDAVDRHVLQPPLRGDLRAASMDRAVIFLYDEVRRRVRAAGAHGIDLDAFSDAQVTVESAPVARRSLEEDRVIEVTGRLRRPDPGRVPRARAPAQPRLHADGRGRPLVRRDPVGPSKPGLLSDDERHLLWTLGKIAALATLARVATTAGRRSRQLHERIDLARDLHEGVIQRLFGVGARALVLRRLEPEARAAVAARAQAALAELRRAMQRPLGRPRPRRRRRCSTSSSA